MSKLIIFENKLSCTTFDITKEQLNEYFSYINYSTEQYQFLSSITGYPVLYFAQENVDYFIEE